MLFRFQIELSDIDRGIYKTLDFRIAQHPSETLPYLLSRVLAYTLSYQEHLEFSPGGLNDPEGPALLSLGLHGTTDLWIEIGNPSARKLHKASKAAQQVIIYTYKNAENLINELRTHEIHRANNILIFAFDSKFLQSLESELIKSNCWSILHQQGHLDINTSQKSISTDLQQFSLKT
jgi:uncharacterized protein YaeQ